MKTIKRWFESWIESMERSAEIRANAILKQYGYRRWE